MVQRQEYYRSICRVIIRNCSCSVSYFTLFFTFCFEITLDFQEAVKIVESSHVLFTQTPRIITSYINNRSTLSRPGKWYWYHINTQTIDYLDLTILAHRPTHANTIKIRTEENSISNVKSLVPPFIALLPVTYLFYITIILSYFKCYVN